MVEVLRPGRYIGGEWNAVHKEWVGGQLKFALCFPDMYEIGMSHLGMRILYGILNREKDVVCERVFAPWKDMEEKIRAGNRGSNDGGGLLSLEGRRKLCEFDIVGFSLQYEMSFVDVLNMLDLGGVRLRSSERGDEDPLVIAGGPCAFNPEPMADFIDAFVIGEAEEAILEIAKLVKSERCKVKGWRQGALKELSKIEGVYVPRTTNHPSTLLGTGEPRTTIRKRIVADLDNAYFPTAPIVPYIQIVHDRIGIEIMRGCPHRCRFCQACKIFHPLRLRSIKRILEIAEQSIKNTGYEEISLLSLSSGDYPHLEELVGKLEERFRRQGVKISLSSLRVREFSDSEAMGIVKKAGLTFAPEVGSDQLRSRLNKDMNNEDIIQNANHFLNNGWRKVKMYFMIGIPGETYEDLDAIVKLVSQIKSVNMSVSPFIPKPHSEFEGEGMDGLDALKDKRRYLRAAFDVRGRRRNIKIDFHDPEMSRIEACLSRGDRKVGEVIYRAWQKGARLQAWTECFDYNLWRQCFEESGIDPEPYLRSRGKGELLPWNFVET